MVNRDQEHQASRLFNSYRLVLIVITIIWVSLITNFSRDLFSAEHTAPYIEKVIHDAVPQLSQPVVHNIHIFVRKLAHIFEYGVLGTLLFSIHAIGKRCWSKKWFGNVLLIVAVISASDEYHQSLTRLRGASWTDCVIDTFGASIALLIVYKLFKARFNSLNFSKK